MPLTSRQKRSLLNIALRKSRDLAKIRQHMLRAYPDLAHAGHELDEEIKDVLDECNVDFEDDAAVKAGC